MNLISKERVWQEVERIRSQHQGLSVGSLPLDLIEFIELDLKLDLIPYNRLYCDFGADAAIMADFSGIYVDGEVYDLIDTAPDWKLNRLRFSLAHELGHYFLHREMFAEQGIVEDEHLLDWLNRHNGEKHRIEQEANEFAGRMIVPVEKLREYFEAMQSHFSSIHGSTHWVSDANIRQKACELIAPKFGVHRDAIAVRLDRDGIWPSPF